MTLLFIAHLLVRDDLMLSHERKTILSQETERLLMASPLDWEQRTPNGCLYSSIPSVSIWIVVCGVAFMRKASCSRAESKLSHSVPSPSSFIQAMNGWRQQRRSAHITQPHFSRSELFCTTDANDVDNIQIFCDETESVHAEMSRFGSHSANDFIICFRCVCVCRISVALRVSLALCLRVFYCGSEVFFSEQNLFCITKSYNNFMKMFRVCPHSSDCSMRVKWLHDVKTMPHVLF